MANLRISVKELHQKLEILKAEIGDIPLTIDGVIGSEDDELQQVLSNLEQAVRSAWRVTRRLEGSK